MAPPVRSFSDQLRDAIRECGLSVAEVARTADVDRGVIFRFLAGERGLTTTTLDALGEALGLRLSARVNGPKARPKPARTGADRRGKARPPARRPAGDRRAPDPENPGENGGESYSTDSHD